nr:hypothetical protein Q903MT_gene1668 [Picea sitchensis]
MTGWMAFQLPCTIPLVSPIYSHSIVVEPNSHNVGGLMLWFGPGKVGTTALPKPQNSLSK